MLAELGFDPWFHDQTRCCRTSGPSYFGFGEGRDRTGREAKQTGRGPVDQS